MHLIWATEYFKIAGRSLVGLPIILHDSMETCTPVNDFLRSYLMRGQISSKKSWEAAGQSLYDYFSFLQAHKLDWRDVDRGESKALLYAYRDYCLEVLGQASATVRLRTFFICRFYEFALQSELVAKLPFGYESRSVNYDKGYMAHADGGGGMVLANDAMPRIEKSLPKYLTMAEIKSLLAAQCNVHHRILIRFALQTGLRRMELGTFPVAYIKMALQVPGETRNILLKLDPNDGNGIRTKRNKPRDVWVSRKLVEEVNRYVTQIRGERAHLGAKDAGRLFVNQYGDPYANNGKALERIVRTIGKSVALDIYPHILRHTYATHTLVSLQRSKGSAEPLVFLKNQLGHSSIQTTMVYAHLADDFVDNAVLQYDNELNQMVANDA